MPDPTVKEVRKLVPILRGQRLDRILHQVLGKVDLDARVEAGKQLRLYVYEWCAHLKFLGDDQIRWLVGLMGPQLDLFLLAPRGEDGRTIFLLTIGEWRWACWMGHGMWADLDTESEAGEEVERPVTMITCNVVELWERKQRWLRKLRGW